MEMIKNLHMIDKNEIYTVYKLTIHIEKKYYARNIHIYEIIFTKLKKMTKPRFELGTHTVLRCCHNQLDHSAN